MANYKIDIWPLEPYTFGTDQGASFDGVAETGKESYIIDSQIIPDQTTVLGTLRYIVLSESNLLRTDYNYSEDNKRKITQKIGDSSFSFCSGKEQDFGCIKKVSPIFISQYENDKEIEIFIKNPFHNKAKDEQEYTPMIMSDKKVITSKGEILLPRKDIDNADNNEFVSKNWYATGYIGINTKKKAPNDLFMVNIQTGNRSSKSGEKDGFFKRRIVSMKDKYCFSTYVTFSDDFTPQNTIAYMGKKNCAFRFLFTEVNEDEANFSKKVEEKFSNVSGTWYMALSDIYIEEMIDYKTFSIIEEKNIRNMETILDGKGYVNKRRKSSTLIHLIKSGSVFYGEEPKFSKNINAENIGYNAIVKLGGNNNGN